MHEIQLSNNHYSKKFFCVMEKGRREGGEAKKNKFLFALDYGYLKPKGKSRCACWGTIIEKKYLQRANR